MRFLKPILFAVSVPAIAILAGCQSSGATAQAAEPVSTQAVTCDNCKVTYVKLPRVEKNRVVAYTTKKSMECPDCRGAAENFFATGKLQHTCKTCGDNLSVCESH